MIKIYFKEPQHKRGRKLTELPDEATYKDCMTWLRKNTGYLDIKPYIRCWVNREGYTIIDYGSWENYIVITKNLMEVQNES